MTPSDDAFLNMPAEPKRKDVARLLGPATGWWDAFLSVVARADIGAAAEWRFYKGKTGWRLLACKKGRNLAYLKPSEGGFLVSMAVSDRVLDAAEQDGVSKAFIRSIRDSKLLPEGRAARVEVTSSAALKTALKLLTCKANERG